MIIDCGSNEAPQRVMLQAFLNDDDLKRGAGDPPWYVQIYGFGDDPTGMPMLEGWFLFTDDDDLTVGETPNEGTLIPADGWETAITASTSIDLDDIAVFRIP